jgi:hypothetical protein
VENDQLILLLIKLVTGFTATVSAVVLWSRTREPAWLFVVMGTVFLYSEIIISTLEIFGLSNFYLFTVYGISLVSLVFAFFPFFFFTIGFILFLNNRKRRF